jgi:hypothetical protein
MLGEEVVVIGVAIKKVSQAHRALVMVERLAADLLVLP